MRLCLPAVFAVLTSISLLGCQGGTSPLAPSGTSSATLPSGHSLAFDGESLLVPFDCTIDLANLEATVSRVTERHVQGPQAKSYDLDIENFLGAGDLKVRGVRRDPGGDLILTLAHAHPFPAPDFTGAISGSNRADLGYTGRLLVLADLEAGEVPSHTWFGDVRLDPELVTNADGYVQPGDLLARGTFTANAFPYVLLVDEQDDNRIGVSNGGAMTGSYDAPNGGWQIANAGTGNTGWTGFDYLHGGQSTTFEVALDTSELAGGPVSLPLAVLIKYTDPRGVGGRTRRFPVEPADPVQFAYRLPFAALDASVVTVAPVGDVEEMNGPVVPLTLTVRDWDARASEAAQPELELESDVSLIQLGASGAPMVEFDAPALFASPVTIAEGTVATGLPNDELQYAGAFSNVLETAAPGGYVGLLRITDPEANDLNADAYHFGVDPDTLQASSTRAIKTITYQAVEYTVVNSLAPPEILSVSPIGTIGGPCEDIDFSANITNGPTSWSWDFGGGATPNASILESPTVTLGTPGTYNGTLTASNAGGSSAPFPFSYTVAIGSTPTWSTHDAAPVNALSFEYDYASVVSHQGRIAIAYNRGNGGPLSDCCDTYFAISSNANPTGPADWTVSSVQTSGVHGQNLDMISSNGQLVISWRNGDTSSVGLAFSQVPVPNGEGDWLKYSIGSGFSGWDTELAEVNGLLAVTYGAGFPQTLHFGRATAPSPSSAAQWQTHQVDNTTSCGNDAGIVAYQGMPVLVSRVYDTGAIRIARATTATPSTTADWAKSDVELNGTGASAYNGTSLGVAVTGDRLAVVYNDTVAQTLTMNIANTLTPAGPSDWTRYNLDPVGDLAGDLDVMTVGGRLALFYTFDENPTPGVDNGGLRAARATSCLPLSAAAWQFSTIITGGGSQGYMPGMGVHDSKLVCTSRTPSTQQITIGSGLW